MSKRFESGTSKRTRKKIENDKVKKIKAITAFLHQSLTKATVAGGEVGALTLVQENQGDEADHPTASIQPEESLFKKAMQDVEQQPGNEELAIPNVKMKMQIYFRIQLQQKEGKTNT